MATANYMNVNVILTFNTLEFYEDPQEFFDIKLPVSKREISAYNFIDNKLFHRVVKKCNYYKRDVRQLIKISTSANWMIFEECTNLQPLYKLGHSCKWFFGVGRNDLDEWEKHLMEKYSFGLSADMSFVNGITAHNQMN